MCQTFSDTKKKMPIPKSTRINQSNQNIFDYLPARLCMNKSGWMITYYISHPVTQESIRVRKRVDNIRKRYANQRDAIAHISKIIMSINSKLSMGINPMCSDNDCVAVYTRIDDVISKYLSFKSKDCRTDTMRSYTSHAKDFGLWCKKHKIVSIGEITRMVAIRYIDGLNDKKCASRTYNNRIKNLRLLFNWAIDHGYCTDNFFETIKTRKNEEKKRCYIDADTRRKISGWFCENNEFPMELMCNMVYQCLIRPKEIRTLKISDIDFENNTITVRSENAKNHHERIVPVKNKIIEKIRQHIGSSKKRYLFSENLVPGDTPSGPSAIVKRFEKMKKALKLNASVQMYGLRDSGITDMLYAGIDPLTVKQLADHHSLAITSIYSRKIDGKLLDCVSKLPDF